VKATDKSSRKIKNDCTITNNNVWTQQENKPEQIPSHPFIRPQHYILLQYYVSNQTGSYNITMCSTSKSWHHWSRKEHLHLQLIHLYNMPQSKWNKSETKAHSIMTMKPTLLMGKHPNNLGTVGKMKFPKTTYSRTHCISFSKILMRHLLF